MCLSVIPRYHTEFGFTLPGRPIVVDDIRIRGVGKAFSETDQLIEQASGPPRVETVSYCVEIVLKIESSG